MVWLFAHMYLTLHCTIPKGKVTTATVITSKNAPIS